MRITRRNSGYEECLDMVYTNKKICGIYSVKYSANDDGFKIFLSDALFDMYDIPVIEFTNNELVVYEKYYQTTKSARYLIEAFLRKASIGINGVDLVYILRMTQSPKLLGTRYTRFSPSKYDDKNIW